MFPHRYLGCGLSAHRTFEAIEVPDLEEAECEPGGFTLRDDAVVSHLCTHLRGVILSDDRI